MSFTNPKTLTKRILISNNSNGLSLLISPKITILNIKFIASSEEKGNKANEMIKKEEIKKETDNDLNKKKTNMNLKKKNSFILEQKSKKCSFEEDDLDNLELIIKEKKEKLENFKNSEKENKKIQELKQLVDKWRVAGQEALNDLLQEVNKQTDEKKELIDLFNAFGIDPLLLHYDEKNGEFY